MKSSITPRQLADRHEADATIELIDVRTPVEFREVHVPFARNVPLDRLDPQRLKSDYAGDPAMPVYVICRSGSRSKQACEKLTAAGVNAVRVEGGTLAWDTAGFPVVRGQTAISLERQVRIAIGLLVLASSALAAFVHPYWIGVAAFMGAGLIFSGITDYCGLALILSRLPWNQVATDSGKMIDDRVTACRRE